MLASRPLCRQFATLDCHTYAQTTDASSQQTPSGTAIDTQTTDRDEPVEAGVAALPIAEEGGDYEAVNNTRIAQRSSPRQPNLVALPPASSANNWMSAHTQSQSSWSAHTPADTDSIVTKTTATSSSSKRDHGRSKSPVKSMVDLALLDRKVERVHMAIKDYSDTIRQLMRNIRDIQRGKGMIPHEIRPAVERREDVEAEEWWWSTTSSALSKSKLLVELEMDGRGWNDKVHSLILRQVCMHLAGIEYQNITTARPDPRLVPKTGLAHTESKLVDYALVCDKTLIPPHVVERILADTRNGIDSINHTRDSVQSLRRNPIAVSFETKTPNGSESEALTQLSLWAATHFNRLRTLLPPGKSDVVAMPLPLIMAVGGRYSLLFVIDGSMGQGIRVFGGEAAFGDCASLEGCYQVLAGLRRVGEWVRETWVSWFVGECLRGGGGR
ncbi:uncharacterized protein ALTATR162_LOCUS10917 [Alternaria atra]|uniref:PD-(D/E)XK nuclease-like domain-containing protein n=1 Tax=Alternaria atra TaxID=119953 RepID=A0A8J2NAQ0_9PLEO|nr:uncharacterized protein ALTATR162_LOCUS10917 [Alternaria atra]CAG5184114.1 unnamed protein product [Alternaria atra]